MTAPERARLTRVQHGWRVRVPASSANVGPAFDALAVALDVHLEVFADGDDPAPETHPAVRAFRNAGGQGPLCVRSRFPGGRGLGFSAAARVAGLLAVQAQHGRSAREARGETLRVATELEGHADNAAAAIYGGVVAVAGRRVVRVPLARELAVVVWIPEARDRDRAARAASSPIRSRSTTRCSTSAGPRCSSPRWRRGRSTRCAPRPRTGCTRRAGSARARDTHAAIEAMLDAGAFGAWLSGSGPSAAAFVDRDDGDRDRGRAAARRPHPRARHRRSGRDDLVKRRDR